MSIFENLEGVESRIAAAARRSGRDSKDIDLVAVTKYARSEATAEILHSGRVKYIGESRVQDAARKKESFSSAPVKWRMIGHLQSNKIKKALQIFDTVDSLDSLELAGSLDAELAKSGRILPVLVQVKLAGSETQYGIKPDQVKDFMRECRKYKYLDIQGLMAIGPMIDPVEAIRPYFRSLKNLFDQLFDAKKAGESQKPVLSMGMSRDFEIAVEEGATMVRLGTVLFAQQTEGRS